MDHKYRAYLAAVTVAAVLFSLLWLPAWDLAELSGADWLGVSAFIFVGILSQAAALDFGAGRQAKSSLAFVPLLATAIVFPPETTLLAAVAVIGFSEIVMRRELIKATFNVSQIVLALGIGAHAYTWLLGTADRTTISLIGTIVLVAIFFAINILLTSAALSFNRHQGFASTLMDVIGPRGGNLLYDVLSSPFVIIVVVQYLSLGIGGVLVVILPLLVLRHSYAGRQKLAHANRDLLAALVKAIETRDPYTSGHSIRVATLAKLIAEDLGLGLKKVDRVRTAALLHDVGKIDPVYSAVILKPHSLTPEERELIQTHATKGADILRDMGSMEKELVTAVRHHHEWYDGTGYPDGLKGEAIPLEARIIMMSDAIDAMLSDRPYRSALSVGTVKSELERYAGQQFDPSIVKVVLKARTLERAVDLVTEWRGAQNSNERVLSVLP
jgi:putative nucleotidyltransferase with HDIG domain